MENKTSISKDKAVEILTKNGYDARNSNGVVMVFYKTEKEYRELSNTLKDFLHQMDYYGSFGIRAVPATPRMEEK